MKTAKRTISFLLSLVLVLGLCSFTAMAEELRYFERGVLTDGTNTAYYIIDKDNKTLYITGNGNQNARTPDYPDAASGPFAGRTDVTRIVVEEDVERIGDYALSNMTKVDTLEIQSNLLSSSSNMSAKAMIGCTGLRHIQGDSALLSTDVFLQVVKGALNIASGNWLSLISNGVSIISTGVNGDDSLDNETIHCMVDDYINSGEKIFLGDLEEAKTAYNERLASPCYVNNAFHHSYYNTVTKQPNCTEEGVRTYICNTCGESYTVPIDALGHSYTASVLYAPSCTKKGITEYECSVCGDAYYTSIPAKGHGDYVYDFVEAENRYYITCADCGEEMDAYADDISALVSAVKLSAQYAAENYTEDSFTAMENAVAPFEDLEYDSTLYYPQFRVDEVTADILTKISELVPYVQFHLTSAPGGSVVGSFNDMTVKTGINFLTAGTPVTVTALPADGYTFVGWYDTTDRKYVSEDAEYSFIIGSNTTLRAVFEAESEATLTFVNPDGQVYARFNKTPAEWQTVASLSPLLPDVPHYYKYKNCAWSYDEAQVLAALREGTSQEIGVTYTEWDYPLPALPVATQGVPALTLTSVRDDEEGVDHLILATDIPDTARVQEFGVLLYYKRADSGFDPSSVFVTINKKMASSLFDTFSEDGYYFNTLSPRFLAYNTAVRGYISYYDEAGTLKTVYSDQINITHSAS